jgi:PAS domain S-box-containing protein
LAGNIGFRADARLNATRVGLLVLDSGGGIVVFNAAAEQILGYSAREGRGRPGEEIFDGLTDLLAGLDGRDPDGRPEIQFRRDARHKDGRTVPLVVTPYAVPSDDRLGSGGGVVLVFQDARHLEKMENQLQHLDRLHSLDEFAAGIVHEIRNPLAGISINAQFMEEDVRKHCRRFCQKIGRSERLHEEMQDILADVQRIEGIVKKVLDFAHPNRSQVRACPVEDIVNEVLRFSRMPLRRQGIRLMTDLKTLARVRVDVPQVEQVFFNIVRNACDAMPKGGELRVGTTLDHGPGARGNGHVRVEVADTGRGIAEENLERIFDPFFSMRPGGTGLGLAISRKIVESHGGRRPSDGERRSTAKNAKDAKTGQSQGNDSRRDRRPCRGVRVIATDVLRQRKATKSGKTPRVLLGLSTFLAPLAFLAVNAVDVGGGNGAYHSRG